LAFAAIQRQGVTITIKGPRQMGKSSLLMRTMRAATEGGKRTLFLDFQLLDRASLRSADAFFAQFAAWLSDELGLPDKWNEQTSALLGNALRMTRYVGRYILEPLGSPLVMALDEVERVFDTDFRSDFFGMLRSWHNDRARSATWRQLDLVLVTSTEPYQLIDNLNQSPFNVGEVIELNDFTPDQIRDLDRRHGSPLGASDLGRLIDMLGGQPYLTRRALYLVASGSLGVDDLFAHALDDRGPFGDHLRHHLFRLQGKEDLMAGLREVIATNRCSDERTFFGLRGAGLVRREGRAVKPRCQIYADYFGEQLRV
jgi:hypothetical protein